MILPRCRDCNHNFVESSEVVCTECRPATCEYCKQATDSLYLLRSHYNLGDRGSSTPGDLKVCEHCISTVCRKCKKRSYDLSSEGICSNCEQDARAYNSYPHDGELCSQCQNMFPLNEGGICRNCYVSNYEGNNKYACAECGKLFIADNVTELLCEECRPSCVICKETFNPADRSDVLCASCWSKRESGICTICGVKEEDLDYKGRCRLCSGEVLRMVDEHSNYWCPVCRVRAVSQDKQVCEHCKVTTKICPDCHFKAIPSSMYICEDCYDKRNRSLAYAYDKPNQKLLEAWTTREQRFK